MNLEKIILIRHGQSMANVGEVKTELIGDHNVELTATGVEQARSVGAVLGSSVLSDSLVYCSPYTRTRQTMSHILTGAGVPDCRVYEDPCLREIELGEENHMRVHEKRKTHGWFYYRFKGGESPADCYDRTAMALESIMREVERKDAKSVVVVSHGITIRCFITRFLHLKVEDYAKIDSPPNCAIITIAKDMPNPVFTCGRWGVEGISLRPGA